ncbi:MAG TPA: PorP/SprF family type IX secretion system membrane protein [Bacteroidia bacterium]|nr:PorP/SprF family type IX secretion system membrane protein [Bacteroidia bacterium]
MKKIFTIIFSSALCAGSAVAQDMHFSQYLTSPLNLNPALTGVMNEDIRLGLNYRNQWKSVSAEPYKTISAAVDGTLPPKRKTNDFFGLGLVVNNDKAGASQLSVKQANLSMSYSKLLDPGSGGMLSLGFQAGAGQRSMSYDALTWDKQYNGVRYDPALASGESPVGSNLTYLDVSFGTNWSQTFGKNFRISTGASLWHINKPSISLSKVAKDPLYMKVGFNFIGQYTLPGRPGTSILPSVVYFQQGTQRLLNLGAAWRYRLVEQSKYTGWVQETALVAGIYYRLQDAAFINVRIDYLDFSFGVNYDFNVSTLQVASSSRGGMELCLMYKKALLQKQRYNPKNGLKFVQY